MPRKLRELIQALLKAGFYEIPGGKGSHRKYTHQRYPGAVTRKGWRRRQTLAGKTGQTSD